MTLLFLCYHFSLKKPLRKKPLNKKNKTTQSRNPSTAEDVVEDCQPDEREIHTFRKTAQMQILYVE